MDTNLRSDHASHFSLPSPPQRGFCSRRRRVQSPGRLFAAIALGLFLCSGSCFAEEWVALELYVGGEEAGGDVREWTESALADREGVNLHVYDLSAEGDGRKRFEAVCSYFKLDADESVPLLYGCNTTLSRPDSEEALKAAIDEMLTMTVFVRSGCPRCANAKRYLEPLMRNYPGFKLVYRDIATDRRATRDMQAVARRYHQSAVSVPVFHFCNQVIVGFDRESTTGRRLESALDHWTYTPRQETSAVPPRTTDQTPLQTSLSVRPATAPPADRAAPQGGGVRRDLRGMETRRVSEGPAGRTSLAGASGDNATDNPDAHPRDGLVLSATGSPWRLHSRLPVPLLLASTVAFSDADDAGTQGRGPPRDGETDDASDEPPPLPLPGPPPLPLPSDEPPPPAAADGELPPPVAEPEIPDDLVHIPFYGDVSMSELARRYGLPLFTIIIGLVDGFNPCAMWVLLFLLSILVNLRSRLKILSVAGTFVVISGLAYFGFMAAWLTVWSWIPDVRPVQSILGLLAIVIGSIHIKDFFAFKQGVSLSIPEAAKPGIYARVRRIVMAENIWGAIIGASVLAVLINIIELLCTAGLPTLYTNVLHNQGVTTGQKYAYLALYNVAYMFDDSVMVAVVVRHARTPQTPGTSGPLAQTRQRTRRPGAGARPADQAGIAAVETGSPDRVTVSRDMSIWIKICGIRDVETGRAVADIGPDAVGLNFYAGSSRAVSPETAREIVGVLPASVAPVGVFVNHAPAEVISICRQVGLTTVQLHGDESPEMLAQLDGFRIIRALRVGEETLERVAEHLQRIAAAGVTLAACLVDADVPGAYGGTGHRAPWKLLADGWDREHWPPMVLAGGLNPGNVAHGIRTVRPWGVDVASGVESSPGEKDLEHVAQFINAARAAASDR